MSKTMSRVAEYTCDGQCGAKMRLDDGVGDPGDCVPDGWTTIALSPLARKAVAPQKSELDLCPTCTALATLLLWDRKRQLKVLAGLSTAELEDYHLTELFDQLDKGGKK